MGNTNNTIKYVSLTNRIIKNLSDEFGFEVINKKELADIDIYLKSSIENSSFGGTKIFCLFSRSFEEKPAEGFLYKVPLDNGLNPETEAEYKTIFKPFRICLSLILANLYPKNDIINSNPKYLVHFKYDEKSNIDTLLGQKLNEIVKRIYLFHQEEFGYQYTEVELTGAKKVISVGMNVDFNAPENKGMIILSFKSDEVILNNHTVLFDKAMIESDDVFKIMSLLNRGIKSSLININKLI